MPTEDLPDPFRAERLTATLQQAGVLGAAAVRDVVVESSRATIVSRIIRLRLTYDRPASDAPASLIAKMGLPERADHGWDGVRNEIAFYTQVASDPAARAITRCYAAHLDEAARQWHLILEDLTDSHFVLSPWPLPPTLEQCERIVAARARFQAAWWGDPRLGVTVGTLRDATAMAQLIVALTAAVEQFFDRYGGNLSPESRSLFLRFIDALPRLSAQYRLRHRMTVAQGDAHPWNCFLPRDGSDDVRFFDWDAWRLDLGVSDLAHMVTVQWYPEQRRRMQQHLLERYHAALLQSGVPDYDMDTLRADYRFAALCQIAWPVWQARYAIPPATGGTTWSAC